VKGEAKAKARGEEKEANLLKLHGFRLSLNFFGVGNFSWPVFNSPTFFPKLIMR
jgi:hypothetical protein